MRTAAGIDQLMSARALARLLAERGPRLLVVVLIIALGLDCALILTRAFNPVGALPAPQASALRAAPGNVNPQLALATIVNAHLFGTAAVTANSDAPPTNMPLILAGVIADKAHPTRGQAIIGANAAAAKLYAVGAMLTGGARLHAVYSDRVLLERNGALETLMLPRTPLPGASAAFTAAPPTRATVQANPAVLAGLVRVQPVFNQGKLSGYRIFPASGGRGTAAFHQLGLRAGDLILAVNGTSLDDPARAMEVLQTLSSSGSATVTVSRNGTAQEVNLNLANLDADGQDNGGQEAGPPPGPIAPPSRRRPLGLPAPSAYGTAGGTAAPTTGERAF